MQYIISLTPIVLFFLLLLYLDSFAIVRKGQLAITILWGIVVALVLYFSTQIGKVSIWLDQYNVSVPIIEEVCKSAILFFLLYKKRIAFFIDAAIYGAAVGVGFSLIENFLYLSNSDISFASSFFRGLGTAFMHTEVTAITGGLLICIPNRKFAFLAILPAILIHVGFNFMVLPPIIMLGVTMIGLSSILFLLFQWNLDYIRKWIETGINDQVELLSSIKSGHLGDTFVGQYIQSIKDSFKSEKVFDMCCYITLYIELSLLNKRNMMLNEVGLSAPKDNSLNDKTIELKSLKKSIGKSGEMALLPILNKL